MTGYQGDRPRAACPICGTSVIVKTHNRDGSRRLRVALVGQHRVPGSGKPTTRAVCSGSGADAPPW